MRKSAHAILGENLDIIVSAFVGLLTVLYAWSNDHSTKAMEAAKEIDAQIPTKQDVVIKPPRNAPDIIELKPFRRVATRYDKFLTNSLASSNAQSLPSGSNS
jgi:hypothetical protein